MGALMIPSGRAKDPGSRRPSAAEPGAFDREFPGASESAVASQIMMGRTCAVVLTAIDQGLRRHGLSAAGRQALVALDEARQPLSPTTLSERLLVTTASMTSLLDTLEARGLVARRPDPDDRRKQLVSLTPAGRALVDKILPELVALQTAIMTGLSESDRRHLLRSLAVIRDSVTEIDAVRVARAAPRRGPRRSDRAQRPR
jgi:DNA-binding MarR family transcriptional regulator